MRPDFSKLLTEKERRASKQGFRDVRHKKVLTAGEVDEVGGKQGIKFPHKIAGYTKEFGEFLSPLAGWVKSCEGKKWDDCYSELCKNFDRRKVTNQHIFEHLFDYILVDVLVLDGKLYLPLTSPLRFFYYRKDGYQPLEAARQDFYVCPRTRIVKKINKANYLKEAARKSREVRKEYQKTYGVTFAGGKHAVHYVEGKWYCFDRKPVPTAQRVQSQVFEMKDPRDPGAGVRAVKGPVRFVPVSYFDELEGKVKLGPSINDPYRKFYLSNKRPATKHHLYSARIILD